MIPNKIERRELLKDLLSTFLNGNRPQNILMLLLTFFNMYKLIVGQADSVKQATLSTYPVVLSLSILDNQSTLPAWVDAT